VVNIQNAGVTIVEKNIKNKVIVEKILYFSISTTLFQKSIAASAQITCKHMFKVE
jgi:hypothetical protein